MRFTDKLSKVVEKNDSLLCVGLDVDREKVPRHLFTKEKKPFLAFNRAIIDATLDLVCCYKLNMAFYESLGINGVELLIHTLKCIPREIPVILDGKRGDIGNTAQQYARAVFDFYEADATTVNPYLGVDSIQPFLEYKNKCIFILCRTSNPSAKDFQDLPVGEEKTPLYQVVASKIRNWNTNGNCGAVVGATYPEELRIVRAIIGDNIPMLIPGIGKQGGDLKKSVMYGTNSRRELAIINSSRSILYASSKTDFASAAQRVALHLKEEINKYR
ncbi:MAG TPA: orotidine-5'-phosphate decarboxylase [Thermoplasmata archaeon]|nr:orotidine-5'-phosphate decarboxylase [Thermoplasmata archaeon]